MLTPRLPGVALLRQPRRNTALRRYPALGYLAGTAALALLLPSGLTVPNSGPPTLAEYAPVPGQGEGQSDTSEVGLPTSGGLGAGGVGEGVGALPPPPPEEPQAVIGGAGVRRPGSKRCVGSPPRQTEDPLAPPCIAFFEGDNGGATARGVTATKVVAVLNVDWAEGGVANNSGPRRLVDCGTQIAEGDNQDDIYCKAFMKFFNARYQTFGRQVHFWANHGLTAASLDEQLRPFVVAGVSGSESYTRLGMISAGYQSQERKKFRDSAPRLIGFRPDYEDSADMAASYVCDKLNNRSVSFTDDPQLTGKPRKFAYWHGSPMSTYDRAVLAALERRCGLKITDFADGINDRTAAARLKAAGVTTVLILVGNTSHAVVTQQATQAAWFPEWVIPGSLEIRAINTNFYGRLADQTQWRHTVGITFDYRRNALFDQPWFRAYREGCPDCPAPGATNSSGGPQLYDALTMLFYGIQSSGPRLTAENIDKGLHAIPPQGSANPYKPAGYFAPGNYTFVKDAAALWWDPAGTPPGSPNQGCYRLVADGKRARAGEWTAGDGDVQQPGPCQGDPF